MFSDREISEFLLQSRTTHVVWVPDTYLGRWESLLQDLPLQLVRVCREGEAWVVAAGLWIGRQRPTVMMQSTGLFESGDALRNVVHDLGIPIFGMIGARNWMNPTSSDSARRFALPILDAWQIEYLLIDSEAGKSQLAEFRRECDEQQVARLAVIGEAV